ncbi:hypothetical protein B0H10DRAFT_2340085 [Mycena sp. CBHHK59/15]|nr:hypothetical protein B0H10DRAFT_2340085 [Mycena sp. CBHHK59/15]
MDQFSQIKILHWMLLLGSQEELKRNAKSFTDRQSWNFREHRPSITEPNVDLATSSSFFLRHLPPIFLPSPPNAHVLSCPLNPPGSVVRKSSGRLPPILKLLQAGTRSSSRLKTLNWRRVLQAPEDFSQAFLSLKAALIPKPQAALIPSLETHKSNILGSYPQTPHAGKQATGLVQNICHTADLPMSLSYHLIWSLFVGLALRFFVFFRLEKVNGLG